MQENNVKKQVIGLLKKLERILMQKITSDIRYVLDDITYCINFLENYPEQDIPQEIKKIYEGFYPLHGGLSDYSLWDDDFDKRLAMNKELEDVQDSLQACMED